MSSALNCRVTFYTGIALSRVHLSVFSFCHNFVVVTTTKGTISVNDLVTFTLTLKLKISFFGFGCRQGQSVLQTQLDF